MNTNDVTNNCHVQPLLISAHNRLFYRSVQLLFSSVALHEDVLPGVAMTGRVPVTSHGTF